jgi:hypothetical protein
MRAAGLAIAGAIGALTSCTTVDLGNTPPDIGLCSPSGGLEYFTTQLWPNYLAQPGPKNCSRDGCHGNATGFPLDNTDPIDFVGNYRVAQSATNCQTPMMSRMLIKPMAGIEAHEGKDLFTMNDPEVQVFLGWFQ